MSDDSTGRILAAIEQLRTDLTGRLDRLEQGHVQLRADLTDGLAKLRTDLMARLDGLDDHLTLELGNADDALGQARSAADSSRIHGEQLQSLEELVLKLEARVAQLEERLQ